MMSDPGARAGAAASLQAVSVPMQTQDSTGRTATKVLRLCCPVRSQRWSQLLESQLKRLNDQHVGSPRPRNHFDEGGLRPFPGLAESCLPVANPNPTDRSPRENRRRADVPSTSRRSLPDGSSQPPDPVGAQGKGRHIDPECVGDGVGEGCRRPDGSALAGSLDTERIDR